jgi:hypothetical protein
MFVNTKSAYKFAEECVARKKAAKAREDMSNGSSSSLDLTGITKRVEFGESDRSIRSESKWLSERNEKFKSEAVEMIQDIITTQEERKRQIMDLIEHNTQIGFARLDSSNERGTP